MARFEIRTKHTVETVYEIEAASEQEARRLVRKDPTNSQIVRTEEVHATRGKIVSTVNLDPKASHTNSTKSDGIEVYIESEDVFEKISLTDLEKKVLKVLYRSAEGNDHDFGFIEDARKSVEKQQLSGVISSLIKKKILVVWDNSDTDHGCGDTVLTQFTWEIKTDDVMKLLAA